MSGEAEVSQNVEKVLADTGEGTESRGTRRRRRRRRRAALETDTPQQRFRMILLIIVVLLFIVTITGGKYLRAMGATIRKAGGIFSNHAVQAVLRPEVIVLVLAALILIYLMIPGLEERFFTMIGFKSNRTRR